ncbi:hypothetical protein ABTN25_19545, partial [Acinetobacter baumannii]
LTISPSFQTPKKRYSVRAYVIAITAIFMIPTLILAGWLAFRSVAFERHQTEQNAFHRAREITTVLERDIVSTQNLLMSLAGSQFLQNSAL